MTIPVQIFHMPSFTGSIDVDTVKITVRALPRLTSPTSLDLRLNEASTITLNGKWFNHAKRIGMSSSLMRVDELSKSDTRWRLRVTPRRSGNYTLKLIDKNVPYELSKVPAREIPVRVTGAAPPRIAKPAVGTPSAPSTRPRTWERNVRPRGCMGRVSWSYRNGDPASFFRIYVARWGGGDGFITTVPDGDARSFEDFGKSIRGGIYGVSVEACIQTADYPLVCSRSPRRYFTTTGGGQVPNCGPYR